MRVYIYSRLYNQWEFIVLGYNYNQWEYNYIALMLYNEWEYNYIVGSKIKESIS